MNPQNSYDEYLSLAKEKLAQKRRLEAEKFLLLATQENEQGYEAYYLLGSIYHDSGKFERAMQCYKKALQFKPNYTEASISLSVLCNDLGQYEEGRLVFNRAREQVFSKDGIQDSFLNEKLAQKHIELGDLYAYYERCIEAEEEYRKAQRLDALNPNIILKIAKLHEKQGSLHASVTELKKLKEENPNYVPGLIKLGLTYYAQGLMIDALKEWEKVLDLDPKNKEALMYIQMAQKAQTTSL